ncbi:Phosphomannomutase [Cupriavidus necator]|uniref:Phosphomannomutase n=1 Tax=Cupriavidus necator (strain ATCC 17699 / DSM 428 / KCTC 22496 / NCIMB 10442 / H16 / Stanier 337) TaxID=381666 RepID=Q0K7R0_CUPNH|nr:phosphomannomutase/phosphoglucomutase [Cupriavidus necator]QCC01732.1 phosphomannomutase/phosphoglucomutase [Cupriavidus necator H16]QQB75437.1 phosphomannomutase/phosphoglucomutase [Cupriavidus necator]WKA40129.1 phosphomannomutase/phosphoglucomutase [Cupriavidus necator]CAJ93961.1 Phosphomannomutase [Cupriavidus necator H16]
MAIDPTMFKAYDIRGIVGKTLTREVARDIGWSFGTAAAAEGEKTVVVGRDGRLSGPDLISGLVEGLRAAGLDVIDIGLVATPMVYFATNIEIDGVRPTSGIMVTGSHNPPDYNGFKMVLAGKAIYGEQIQALRQRIEAGQFSSGAGTYKQVDVRQKYLDRIISDVKLARPMKVALDAGNGVAGAFVGDLFRGLGCEVTELFCDVDGNFPNHHPDPAHIENLQDLMKALRETDCELGLAFDGDGDRLGVVTKDGQVIFPDRQLMLFAEEILSRNPGAQVIYDVKCTGKLAPWIREHGGEPLMWKTGHSLVKAKLKETGAPIAGEMSGHVFFKDRWYGFDDGLYTGARLLEILSRHADPSAVLNALPNANNTPELQLKCAEGEPFTLLDQIKANAKFEGAREVITIDGVRVEYADGFGLARPSNTTPVVVMRFEADNDAALARIQAEFKRVILAEKPDAQLPF